MKTELEIVEHAVVPAEKIQVQKFELRNVHLHRVLLTCTRTMSALIEMDGVNTGAGLAQNEARNLTLDWERVKKEWERALKFSALPTTGGLEAHFFILVMTHNQILSCGNVRAQAVLGALRSFIERVISSDSAGQEYDVQVNDQEAIKQHIEFVDTIMEDYAGKIEGDEFNRGMNIPAHTHLGVVIPPESMGEADTYEPSPTRPVQAIPDTPDLPSSVPAPSA